MPYTMYALVDCNNFYVSCERLFNPALKGRPVAVLSNNDGCIVARSEEVKELGIKMGTPYFKAAAQLKEHNAAIFSSNYTLYGDISSRVMTILASFTPDIQVYSIDEAFLLLPPLPPESYTGYAREIRKKVTRCSGIPVSVGIAPTMTLAKFANQHAKKRNSGTAVFNSAEDAGNVLRNTRLHDIWGIGRASARRLEDAGIKNISDLLSADDSAVRRTLGVNGLRTVYELKGVPAFTENHLFHERKSICCSRSFGKMIYSLEELKESLLHFCGTALAKLRAEKLAAETITVFFNIKGPDHSASNTENFRGEYISVSETLRHPSNINTCFSRIISSAAEKLYTDSAGYRKAGVILSGLVPENHIQGDLFLTPPAEKEIRLMHTVDRINREFGRNSLFFTGEGIKRKWAMKQEKRSPAYTLSWKELPVVHPAPS